jgi:hypothetical protein
MRHPEASFFEAVRISSDEIPVILRLRFRSREDLIQSHRHPEASFLEAVRISSFSFFILTKHSKDEIATSHNTLLAMTEKVDEILTSSSKNTGLLRMTERVEVDGGYCQVARVLGKEDFN